MQKWRQSIVFSLVLALLGWAAFYSIQPKINVAQPGRLNEKAIIAEADVLLIAETDIITSYVYLPIVKAPTPT